MKKKITRILKTVNLVLVAGLACIACCLFVLAASQRPSLFGYTAFVANDQEAPTFFVASNHAADMKPGTKLMLEVGGKISMVRVVETNGNAIYYLDDTQTLSGIYMGSSQCLGGIVFESASIGSLVQWLRQPQVKWALIIGGCGLFLICGGCLVWIFVKKQNMRRRAYYDALLEAFLHPDQVESAEVAASSDEIFEIESAELENPQTETSAQVPDEVVELTDVVCVEAEPEELLIEEETEPEETIQPEQSDAEEQTQDQFSESEETTEDAPSEAEPEEDGRSVQPAEEQDELPIRWELVEQAQIEGEHDSVIREELIQPAGEQLILEEKTSEKEAVPPQKQQ